MKLGKVPENVLKRSILKQIKTKRPDYVIAGAGVGIDAAGIQVAEDEVVVLSTDPITSTTADMGYYGVHVSANDIAASGAEPIGVLVCGLLPPNTREIKIRTIMEQIERACGQLHIQAIGGHTEITDAVTRPVLTVTGVGVVKKDALQNVCKVKPGQDIVATKWIGLEGTAIIATAKEAELLEIFPKYLVEEAKGYRNWISVVEEAAIAKASGANGMHDITEGGIFGALWEMAEGAGVGLDIDLMQIPVRQTTIEICNHYDINPYEMMSSGSLLIACDDGVALVAALEEKGIPAAVIGKATEGNDRTISNGEETRYLEPAKSDAIYQLKI